MLPYRRAVPRRQHSSIPRDLDLWPFDLMVNECRAPAMGMCIPSMVLIARVVFVLERGHTGWHSHRCYCSPCPLSSYRQHWHG